MQQSRAETEERNRRQPNERNKSENKRGGEANQGTTPAAAGRTARGSKTGAGFGRRLWVPAIGRSSPIAPIPNARYWRDRVEGDKPQQTHQTTAAKPKPQQ
jgi:hypothetical protein